MSRTLISGFSVRRIDHLCQSSVCRPEMNRTFTWRARIFHSTIKLRGNSNLRKRRDSNPRCLAARRFSRPVQSTNSATLPNLWRMTDSNRRPPACKAGALANWANSPISCGDTTRTCDLQVMSLTSYQLLYSAILIAVCTRFELVTSCVTGRRPNQLDQQTFLKHPDTNQRNNVKLICRLRIPFIYYRIEKMFFLNSQSKISSFFQNLLVNLT